MVTSATHNPILCSKETSNCEYVSVSRLGLVQVGFSSFGLARTNLATELNGESRPMPCETDKELQGDSQQVPAANQKGSTRANDCSKNLDSYLRPSPNSLPTWTTLPSRKWTS